MPKAGRFYITVDVNFVDEYACMSSDAIRLFIEMVSFSKRLKTNGQFAPGSVERCSALEERERELALTDLCFHKLVKQNAEAPGGLLRYSIPSFGGWNGSSTAKQEAGRKGGLISGERRRAEAEAKQAASSEPKQALQQEKRREEKSKEKLLSEPFASDFSECWVHYPRKEARRAAYLAYATRRREGATAADLMTATVAYLAKCKGKDTEFIKLGATFYGPKEHWREELAGFVQNVVVRCPICGDPHERDACAFLTDEERNAG